MHIKVYSDTFSKQENHKLLHFQLTPTNFSHRTTKESAFFCFEKENGDRNFPPSGTVEVLYSNHITCWHDSTIRAVSMLVGKTLDHTNLNGDSIQCPPTKKSSRSTRKPETFPICKWLNHPYFMAHLMFLSKINCMILSALMMACTNISKW